MTRFLIPAAILFLIISARTTVFSQEVRTQDTSIALTEGPATQSPSAKTATQTTGTKVSPEPQTGSALGGAFTSKEAVASLLGAIVGAIVGGLLSALISKKLLRETIELNHKVRLQIQEEETETSLRALETELRSTVRMMGKSGEGIQAEREYTVAWALLRLPGLENVHKYFPGLTHFPGLTPVVDVLSVARSRVSQYNARAELSNARHAQGENELLNVEYYAQKARVALLQAADYLGCFLNYRPESSRETPRRHVSGTRRLRVELRLPTDRPVEDRIITFHRNLTASTELRVFDNDLREVQRMAIGKGCFDGKAWVHAVVLDDVVASDWYVFQIVPYPGPAYASTELDTADWKICLEPSPEEDERFVKATSCT